MSLFPIGGLYGSFITPDNSLILPKPRQVLSILGYRNHEITKQLELYVRTDLAAYERTRVIEILTELAQVDADIKQAIADSGISKTCNTEISWARQIKFLRQQGHELLKEFGRIHDIGVQYSRFSRNTRHGHSMQYQ